LDAIFAFAIESVTASSSSSSSQALHDALRDAARTARARGGAGAANRLRDAGNCHITAM
jgi:hypothetical protein